MVLNETTFKLKQFFTLYWLNVAHMKVAGTEVFACNEAGMCGVLYTVCYRNKTGKLCCSSEYTEVPYQLCTFSF